MGEICAVESEMLPKCSAEHSSKLFLYTSKLARDGERALGFYDLHVREPNGNSTQRGDGNLMSPPNIDAFPGIIVFVFITSFSACKSLISHPM